MKKILIALIGLGLASVAYAITVNPASNVTADSASTGGTIVLRDTNGDFQAGTITATVVGSISGSGTSVVVSSAATSAFSMGIDGAFTSAQISAKTPAAAGRLVFNTTLLDVCVSTGTGAGAYQIIGSTLATTGERPCK